jgi:hypothetical protein
MNMAYVYRHIRLDKNEPFYIGIGGETDGKYKRAYQSRSRNNIWQKIVNKTDYRVEIIMDGLTWEEACQKEIELIALYGRKDLNKGTLSNLTDGGDGALGVIVSKFTKEKMKESQKKKFENGYQIWNKGKEYSDEHKLKLRENHCSKKEGFVSPKGMLGKKHNEETLKKMSEWQKGLKRSEEEKRKTSDGLKRLYANGYINPASKKVINIETNEIYNSAAECERKTGYKKLHVKLSGERKNTTPFKYL